MRFAISRWRWVSCAVCLSFFVGCSKEPIRTYAVKRDEIRLIGAILPPIDANADSVWTVKMSGPAAAIGEHKEIFLQFVRSIRPTTKIGQVDWKLPEGWKASDWRERGDTVKIQAELGLQVTVVEMPSQFADPALMLNIWRRQLSLPRIKPAELESIVKPFEATGFAKALLIDLTRFEKAREPYRAPLEYSVPAGWQTQEIKSQDQFVAFQAGDGDAKVDASITSFSGDGGGIVRNVNRWRGQVGLPPLGDAEAIASAKSIEIDGSEAYQFDIAGSRMIVVFFLHEGQTWFFKMVGPEGAVGKQLTSFDEMLKSAKLASADRKTPFEAGVPSAWSKVANKTPDQHAVYEVGSGVDLVNVSVTTMSGAAGGIEANVNRWRGQLGLAELPADAITKSLAKQTVAGQTASRVDMTGNRMAAAMTFFDGQTWFFKMMGADAAVKQQLPKFDELLKSIRFYRREPIKYAAPPAWKKGKSSPLIYANFTAGEKETVVDVSVSSAGGTLESNVNRWRGQLDLPNATADEIEKSSPKSEIAGRPVRLVDLKSAQKRILAAMIDADGTKWFVKMTGGDKAVEAHKAEFDEFLKTVRISVEE